MKLASEKQLAYINNLKCVINENGMNPIDDIDIRTLTSFDASILIRGLLDLIKCNKMAYRGIRVSYLPLFTSALDKVYDTIDKYHEDK